MASPTSPWVYPSLIRFCLNIFENASSSSKSADSSGGKSSLCGRGCWRCIRGCGNMGCEGRDVGGNGKLFGGNGKGGVEWFDGICFGGFLCNFVTSALV